MKRKKIIIGIPVFTDVDLLDVTAPMEVLGVVDEFEVVTIAPTPGSSLVKTKPHLGIMTHFGLDDAPKLDVLLVPGGPGLDKVLLDVGYRRWLVERAEHAKWVGSICAGALWLAAAGLLDGYKATTHWASIDLLKMFENVDVMPGYPRFTIDRNRLTTGGVSSALDASLELCSHLLGERQTGSDTELLLQYAPDPPYGTGTPDIADQKTKERVEKQLADMIKKRREIIRRIIHEKVEGNVSEKKV